MGEKGTILSLLLVPVVLSTIVLVIFLTSQQQNVQPSTKEVAAATSCPAPDQVSNVKVTFPNCDGANCSFTQASCSWTAVSGATSYTVKITQVETKTVVQNTSVDGSTVKVVFTVVPNNTYQCDIAAVNSCGASGAVGTDSLFCKVDATFTATPSPPPGVTVTATPAPSPAPVACGGAPCNVVGCQAGSVCMQTVTGQFTCGMPQYQSVCQQSPSVVTCCSAPPVSGQPQPTLLPSGDSKPLTVLGIGGLSVMLIGGAALLLL